MYRQTLRRWMAPARHGPTARNSTSATIAGGRCKSATAAPSVIPMATSDMAETAITVQPGTVTVDGLGSTWTNSSTLNISFGTLNITGGGTVGAAAIVTGTGLLNFDGGTLKANAASTTWLTNTGPAAARSISRAAAPPSTPTATTTRSPRRFWPAPSPPAAA